MEFFSCDANLVIFWKIEMFTASLSLAPKDTPLTGKKYKGGFDDSRRGGNEKTDGPCEPSARDLIITTICYNSQLPILLRLLSNYF